MNGYCKLKKDPKGENLTVENVLLRGSVLRNCEWFTSFNIKSVFKNFWHNTLCWERDKAYNE